MIVTPLDLWTTSVTTVASVDADPTCMAEIVANVNLVSGTSLTASIVNVMDTLIPVILTQELVLLAAAILMALTVKGIHKTLMCREA